EWVGRFRGRPRSAAILISTSTSRCRRSNSAREGSSKTTGARQRGNRRDKLENGAASRSRPQDGGDDRNRRGHVHAREARYERVRARGRRCLPHLFHLFAWSGRPLGHVSVALPRTQGAQREGGAGGRA